MLSWASANRTVFYTQVLSRLFPAPQKDDPDVQVNTQVNIGNMSDFEAAQRIAFALAKATHEQALPVIEAERAVPEPAFDPHVWTPPVDEPDMKDPGQLPEASDPAYTRWIEELPLTDEQRADNALIRNTLEANISTYVGSSAEQFDAPRRPSASQPSVGDRRRAIMARRRDLL
ncbi:hypothetical protein ACF8LD_12890 [Pseudomonas sp. zbq_5]|uniref:hypothetical protein n=1 Tax=unclassified Pseudomonas TaxID=196821 RepID=UPI00370AAA96